MTPRIRNAFQQTVLGYYRSHGRHDLPWRVPEPDGSFDPYKILVSEIMLQQTQVPRVVPKFTAFIMQFPSFEVLANMPLGAVLQAWSGLGYNRRAKYLWQAAQTVTRDYGGALPHTSAELVALPGIGVNTAGAVLAYAFNQPVVFIETNVRTVFIHHFFADTAAADPDEKVHDRDLLEYVAATVPDNVREWYWALMDYGAHLKQTVGNLNVRSRHYAKQSTFMGSRRRVRGQVLRLLGDGVASPAVLQKVIADERLTAVLNDLLAEGLITRTPNGYTLPQA